MSEASELLRADMERLKEEMLDAIDEYVGLFEFLTTVGGHIRDDADVHNLLDYVRLIERENERLRHVSLTMLDAIRRCSDVCETCPMAEEACDESCYFEEEL